MTTTSSQAPKLVSAAFATGLIAIVAYFLFWGYGYTHGNHPMLFVLATLFGVFMAFNIGGNDVANSFGTSVGAGTLTVPQALGIAAIFEVSGAVIAGGEVTKTIRSGIVDLGSIPIAPMDFVFIMMAALLAAALWLLFATKKALPVSTTHSIIGGIVGASLTLGLLMENVDSLGLVQWHKIGEIAISWVLSPVLGGLMAFVFYSVIKYYVVDFNTRMDRKLRDIKARRKQQKRQFKAVYPTLSPEQRQCYDRDEELYEDHDEHEGQVHYETGHFQALQALDAERDSLDAHRALRNWVPLICSIGIMMITAMLLFKGLKNLNMGLNTTTNILITGMVGALVWVGTFMYAQTIKHKNLGKSTFVIFSWMQVFTASGFAFSHGANDIANAIGPFVAVLEILREGAIIAKASIPPIAMLTFGIALIVGLWFIGKEVIQTVGKGLAKMHPASGFTAELSAATMVMLASLLGLPVSSTHILVGAVLGIGLVNRNANWKLMKPIGTAWVVTLPSAAALSAIVFLGLRGLFG